MGNRHLQAKSLHDVVEECVQRSPEAASFRELLEMACRQAAARMVVADPSTTAAESSPEAEGCACGEGSTAGADGHGVSKAAYPKPFSDGEPAGLAISELAAVSPTPPVATRASPAVHAGSGVIVGEVIETQHPLRPGRVLVRWQDAESQTVTEWLLPERHLSLRAGDRVLLALPCGWQEWIVTGALGPEPQAPESTSDHARQITLDPGEVVRFVGHDGRALFTVRQSSEGPVVELGEDNVELKVARTLRLSAQTVEINASTAIDLRSNGDTVVRGRTIRLN